jgi:uncharacterized protein (DUF111 family)
MERESKLFLFQIDHLCGEDIGNLIDMIYEWGAKNVQVFSTVTKKSRPGYVVIVDIGSKGETILAKKLADEFGVFGYHVIRTIHFYQPIASSVRNVTVRCGDKQFKIDIRFNHIESESVSQYWRVEYDDLRKLQHRINEYFSIQSSLPALRKKVESLFTKEVALVLEISSMDA